jgi:hypothetical protein
LFIAAIATTTPPTHNSQVLSGLPVVQGLLELRARLAGHTGPPLSPKRFLFETVGEVGQMRRQRC